MARLVCQPSTTLTIYYAAFLRDPDGNKIEFVTFSRD
jgi:hypothetical protein